MAAEEANVVTRLALAAAALLLQGCMAVSRTAISEPSAAGAAPFTESSQHESIPQLPGGGVDYAFGAHHDLLLESPELNLYVRSSNTPDSDQDTLISFGPWMLPIIPWLPSLRYLFLSHPKPLPPFDVEVQFTSKGRALSFDPGRVTLRERTGFWGREEAPLIATSGSCGSGCFLLRFDVSPSPDRTFVLSLEEVMVEDRPLRLPQIRFEEASLWYIEMAP